MWMYPKSLSLLRADRFAARGVFPILSGVRWKRYVLRESGLFSSSYRNSRDTSLSFPHWINRLSTWEGPCVAEFLFAVQYCRKFPGVLATHSSILAWEIPWTEEPGEIQFMGSQRSRTRLSDWACTHALQELIVLQRASGKPRLDSCVTAVRAMRSIEAGSAGGFGLMYLRQQQIFSTLDLECEGQMRKKCKPESKRTLLNTCPRIQVSAPWIAPQSFYLRAERWSVWADSWALPFLLLTLTQKSPEAQFSSRDLLGHFQCSLLLIYYTSPSGSSEEPHFEQRKSIQTITVCSPLDICFKHKWYFHQRYVRIRSIWLHFGLFPSPHAILLPKNSRGGGRHSIHCVYTKTQLWLLKMAREKMANTNIDKWFEYTSTNYIIVFQSDKENFGTRTRPETLIDSFKRPKAPKTKMTTIINKPKALLDGLLRSPMRSLPSGGAGDWTRGLVHAKHTLYHWATPPSIPVLLSYVNYSSVL